MFDFYLEGTSKIWKWKCGTMGNHQNGTILHTLFLTDDQVVITEDYDDFNFIKKNLFSDYKTWRLQYIINETGNLCIGGNKMIL